MTCGSASIGTSPIFHAMLPQLDRQTTTQQLGCDGALAIVFAAWPEGRIGE
jgi:hypothetical protein